jgi:hypothetical protein
MRDWLAQENTEKQWKGTIFPKQCFLVCPGLQNELAKTVELYSFITTFIFFIGTFNYICVMFFQDKLGLSQLPPVSILPLGKSLICVTKLIFTVGKRFFYV